MPESGMQDQTDLIALLTIHIASWNVFLDCTTHLLPIFFNSHIRVPFSHTPAFHTDGRLNLD